MIEMTVAAHDAAEIEILADALQSIAAYRRREIKAELAQLNEPAPDTITVTPTEAPKRRGRPPKAAKVDEAAAEAAEERAAIQAEATMTVAEPEPDDDIPLPPPPPPAPTLTLTLETVRAALAEASQAGKTAGVRAALAAVKATRLTEVKPEDYRSLLDKVNAL